MIPLYKVPYGLSQDETTERANRAMDDMYSKVGGVWTFKKDFDYYALQKTNPVQITSTDWQEVSFYSTQIETPDLSALLINLNIPNSYIGAGIAKTRLDVDSQTICCNYIFADVNPFTMNGLAQNIKKGKHLIKVFAITENLLGGSFFLPTLGTEQLGLTNAPYVFANLWCVGFK